VRHAGWMMSVALAVAAMCYGLAAAPTMVLWLTAFDGLLTDLLGFVAADDTFFCGNFGLLLLDKAAASHVRKMIEKSVRVTMMRGAQSAGIVTYVPKGKGAMGIRKRVVNGKRTDLCDLLMAKCGSKLSTSAVSSPQLFQGHTRFATSSIAALPGCHPHQWSPGANYDYWTQDASGGCWSCECVNHETFITHNGDLDFYEWHGVVYPLEDVFTILEKILHRKPPATVDSQGVAGLLDLLRTKGMWYQSVRYAYLAGGLKNAGNLSSSDVLPLMWSASTLLAIVAEFEKVWRSVSSSAGPDCRNVMLSHMLEAAPSINFKLPPSTCSPDDAPQLLVRAAIDAFFDQDLFTAAQELLRHAEGSFGLCLSTSVDAAKEVVVAARGQTMSIAFWPKLGVLTWGSEAAATKTGLGRATSADRTGAADPEFMDGYRFDLDDVNGECVHLCWGSPSPNKGSTAVTTKANVAPLSSVRVAPRQPPNVDSVDTVETIPLASERDDVSKEKIVKRAESYSTVMRYGEGCTGALRVTHIIEGRNGSTAPFMKRVLRLGGNPFVEPLPPLGGKDPVGADISDIPKVCKKIVDDWNNPSESLNRLTALTLLTKLRKRLLMHANGNHDGGVDLLITGCEVSLWCGEQFASDMHNAFPKLKIVTMSANKLLAQLGQAFPIPNTGFDFNENSYHFKPDSCALLLSHSGGTFATLNVSNLLKGAISNIFVVTSEWDTQVAKSVRAGKPGTIGKGFRLNSFVFTTFCGTRPAEPVSLTVVATHHLLTQLLLYLMYAVRYYHEDKPTLGGSTFTIQEVQELETLHRNGITDLEEMVSNDSSTIRQQLLAQGIAWSRHVLEGPTTWIISATYILATVVAGYTPLSCLVKYGFTNSGRPLGPDCTTTNTARGLIEECTTPAAASALTYCVAVLDAFIYIFLPIWTAFLLRLLQGRPILHRVAGRSLLIGDVPWVSQTLEAFVSKCFALSYSIASISVASSNPIDHLVHRHTHRVVRGSLLAVGRPDGRLNALSAAENAACLAVNQASSIQNYGVTCESFTLGHNPFKLPLTAAAIHIPTNRKDFYSEHALKVHQAKTGKSADGMSAAALMGTLSTLDSNVFSNVPQRPPAQRPEFIKQIEPMWGDGAYAEERFIGEWMGSDEHLKDMTPSEFMEKQAQLQELYEGRIASMQRCVGFLILFHAMAKRVMDFWSTISFGILAYDMSRSHSIMRIATTASPISGSDVRHKMIELAEVTAKKYCADVLQPRWIRKRLKGGKDHRELSAAEIEDQIESLRRVLEKRQAAS